MAAIDLYSGIGGWTLGFKMAGIPVVASYEWWKDANQTHNRNFHSDHAETNIRELQLKDLPNKNKVQFVVGSPPCTQFSFSNRGGKGNIADGMVDMYKFLEVVEYMSPKYWAMENVPRVAGILEKEIEEGGSLHRFKHLFGNIRVYNLSDYGVPQDRKRMIAGRFPFDLLDSYQQKTPRLHLSDVIRSLDRSPVIDPVYKLKLSKKELTDHILEASLSKEEERINRESKTHHPVYNAMSFPDRQDRPSRTITALCTRVSRESIIIEDPHGNLRRLTVRERGCVQSFPITYQFFSKSYAGKIKMIGNAIPPLMTFYIAQSMKGTKLDKLLLPDQVQERIVLSKEKATSVPPEKEGARYQPSRSFWLAIRGLRFGSGVRFDLKNIHDKETGNTKWSVNFFFGNSKNISQVSLDSDLQKEITAHASIVKSVKVQQEVRSFQKFLKSVDANKVQRKWANLEKGTMGPIELLDTIALYVDRMAALLEAQSDKQTKQTINFVDQYFGDQGVNDRNKILKHTNRVLTGMLLGTEFNAVLNADSIEPKTKKKKK